jgi:hypothetical protein
VATLDRRKLAAPVFAQAASFVVVLVIGGFTGHSTAPSGPAHAATPSAGASVSTPAVGGRGPKLTVKVVEQATDGVRVSGSQVKVLQNGTLTTVASGILNTALEFAANVPAGAYQVCLSPPIGWSSAVRGTHALAGWICSTADVGTAPLTVTFRLTPQSPQAVP